LPEAALNDDDKQHNASTDAFGVKKDNFDDMMDNKVQSQKSSSDSSNLSDESQISMQSINNRGPFLPEPLPLFDGPAEDEPSLL
jgi:hypothetical protein